MTMHFKVWFKEVYESAILVKLLFFLVNCCMPGYGVGRRRMENRNHEQMNVGEAWYIKCAHFKCHEH